MNHFLDDLAKQIFEQNKAVGWWDDMDRCIFQTLQLVSTEVAEATEGERKNLMDDHIPTRKMGEVELADALIRILDLAGRYDWGFRGKMVQHQLILQEYGSPKQVYSIGRQHFAINMALTELASVIYLKKSHDDIEKFYSVVIQTIDYVGHLNDYDVMGALREKLEYNKTRADHKRENRQADDGKKF